MLNSGFAYLISTLNFKQHLSFPSIKLEVEALDFAAGVARQAAEARRDLEPSHPDVREGRSGAAH